jgi:hypothetical protein
MIGVVHAEPKNGKGAVSIDPCTRLNWYCCAGRNHVPDDLKQTIKIGYKERHKPNARSVDKESQHRLLFYWFHLPICERAEVILDNRLYSR